MWIDALLRRLRTGSPRTERANDCLGSLVAAGFAVRHDRPKTPGRLTTNGVGAGLVVARKTGGSGTRRYLGLDAENGDWLGSLVAGGWVVRHGSFDRLRTGLRRTPDRLTTNGVGDGIGARRTAWVGWVVGLCGSTRASDGLRPGSPRTGWWVQSLAEVRRASCWRRGQSRLMRACFLARVHFLIWRSRSRASIRVGNSSAKMNWTGRRLRV